jgi:hypothetical protein
MAPDGDIVKGCNGFEDLGGFGDLFILQILRVWPFQDCRACIRRFIGEKSIC